MLAEKQVSLKGFTKKVVWIQYANRLSCLSQKINIINIFKSSTKSEVRLYDGINKFIQHYISQANLKCTAALFTFSHC